MARCEILVLGSINTDLVIQGPRLPAPGETVLGGTFYQAAGGKGANQAVAAARAGGRVGLIAAIGDDDFGRSSRDGLAADGVLCDFVKTVPGRPSGVALIMVDQEGQNCISVASGANLQLTPADIDRIPEEVFRQAKILLACLEAPWETVLRGLQRARQCGLTTILNPAPADPRAASRDALALVDVITPNESEASLLLGTTVDDVPSALAAGLRLKSSGCGAAIVTLGSRGCVVVGGAAVHLDALDVRAVDATAAGDAFNGVLAVALAEGQTMEAAAGWASIAGGLAVTRRGAQPSLPRRDELEAYRSARLQAGSALS